MPLEQTPKDLAYRFPAEWEAQAAVWFAWPLRDDLWPGRLQVVREQLVQLYLLAARYQRVCVLCAAAEQRALLDLLNAAGAPDRIELFDCATDDIWIRDYGPIFLRSQGGSELAVADWRFNAWGGKFPRYQQDDRATAWIADHLALRHLKFEAVLEGGAVESNGLGQLLTTEAVLLNPNRNGETSIQAMEQKLCAGLGLDSVLWLKDGLAGDDTDGHIDNLARFFKPDGILLAHTEDPANPNFEALQENGRRVHDFRTPDGLPFDCVHLPMPSLSDASGEPLAASYLNYLVLNGAVLVPSYRQPELDRRALDVLGDCFPGREVVGFDCSDIIHEGGALHCMSQNQPLVPH